VCVSSNPVDAAVDCFTNTILQDVDLEVPRSCDRKCKLLTRFLAYWFTIFGKRLIFIGDAKKASIVIVNDLTTGSLLKLQLSVTY
jgi:hypothetical protein